MEDPNPDLDTDIQLLISDRNPQDKIITDPSGSGSRTLDYSPFPIVNVRVQDPYLIIFNGYQTL